MRPHFRFISPTCRSRGTPQSTQTFHWCSRNWFDFFGDITPDICGKRGRTVVPRGQWLCGSTGTVANRTRRLPFGEWLIDVTALLHDSCCMLCEMHRSSCLLCWRRGLLIHAVRSGTNSLMQSRCRGVNSNPRILKRQRLFCDWAENKERGGIFKSAIIYDGCNSS